MNNPRIEIKKILDNLVENWPDERYDNLNKQDKGFLLAHGSCGTFAKEAIERLKPVVDPKDIIVIEWRNKDMKAYLHTCFIIYGRLYDSNVTEGYDLCGGREPLNDLFLCYASRSKFVYGDCGYIQDKDTNKVIFNPWPREGIVYMPYIEYRYSGVEYFNKNLPSQ